jgi:REP element-mobilizing transposase RayT
MARPWRITFPNADYHITARGNNRQDIFLDDHDRRAFIGLLEKASERFNLRIMRFCLTSNH